MSIHSESFEGAYGRLSQMYRDAMASADPRVSEWAFMQSPLPTIFMILVYLIGIVWYGQKWMQNRPNGFELRPLMVIYNMCMVVYSLWLLYEFAINGWVFGGYSLSCQPVDRSKRIEAMRMANACWWFYFSKFIELFDTLLFVLRKKLEHITFLHVFHHASMPILWWIGVKFVPGKIIFA